MSQVYVGNGSGGGGGSGIQIIDGDVGFITGSTVTIFADTPIAGATVRFVNSGTISQLQVSDSNGNTFVGQNAGKTTVTGGANTGFGTEALFNITSGTGNNAFGGAAGFNLTTGRDNCFFGEGVCENLISGSGNIVIGSDLEGQAYTSSESNNILISNTGVTGESNVMRLGTTGSGTGQVNKSFLAGTNGVSVSNQLMVVMNSATEQLGTIAPSSAGTRILIDSQTASNSASLTFTVPVTYNNYILLYSNVTLSSGVTTDLLLQLNTGSGVIVAGYQSGLFNTSWAGSSGSANTTLGFLLGEGSSLDIFHGTINLYNLTSGTNAIGSIGDTFLFYQSTTSIDSKLISGYPLGGVVSSIQISAVAGNIATGTFTLYGLVE